MDKFKSFKLITDKYLGGKLVDLHIDYQNEKIVNVLVSYECNNFFTLDYEIDLDIDKHDVKFISHGSSRAFEKIRLSSEPTFDKAVSNFFFAN
jgi:hypothetical protein